MMHQLEQMKERLMNCVQGEIGDLQSVDSKELGEAIDMIKDLSEAMYYCSIVEAMKETSEKEKHGETHIHHYETPMMYNDRGMGRMYYPYDYNYNYNYANGGSRNYSDYMEYNQNGGNGSRYYQDGNRQTPGESRNYTEHPVQIRDYREGRSGESRRNYMESKEMHKDKNVKMQELEKYMHELSGDLTEMIDGASAEEKQIMKNKLTTLAGKIV